MDILTRYGISGYFLFFILFLYAPPAFNFLLNNGSDKSLSYIIIVAILGIPLGYLINQVTSFFYHIIPFIGFHWKRNERRFISLEAREEMEIYRTQLTKFKKDFDFRAWYSWRWTHLTINLNLMISIIIALIVASILNGLSMNLWHPIYTLRYGDLTCSIFIFILFIVLLYNSYLLKWFIISMHEEINEIKINNK